MSKALFARRAAVVASVVAAVGTPPLTAHAATHTGCTSGFRGYNSPNVLLNGCSSFSPSGAPYVFTIGTLYITSIPPQPPAGGPYPNAVANCASYGFQGSSVQGQNCTFQY